MPPARLRLHPALPPRLQQLHFNREMGSPHPLYSMAENLHRWMNEGLVAAL